ncbi:MAG: YqiJ family protein [Pseudomonadota bacterium]
MTELVTPAYAPFAIALTVMALIAALEIAGLLFGVAFSGLIDSLFPDLGAEAEFDPGVDADSGDAIGRLFAWLYVGKVPVLIVFAAFLAGFGLSGAALQSTTHGALGVHLPLFLATPLAFLASLPATRFAAGVIARILPREQSDAVSADSLVGRVARIIRGQATQGTPAEAKVADEHGLTHYILVEPDEAGASFREGAEVLLVEKKGAVFHGAVNNAPVLSPSNIGDEHA